MKKYIFPILLLSVLVFPSHSDASSLKVLSPKKDTVYYFGDTLPIRWTPKSIGISSIELAPVSNKETSAGLFIYGLKVLGNPVNRKGKFDYELPQYLATPVGEYKVKLTTEEGKTIKGPTFVINSFIDNPILPIKRAHFKFGNISGLKPSYAPGKPIDFDVKAYESGLTSATYSNGFNIQAHVFDPKNKTKGAYEAVNATYDPQSTKWHIAVTAPDIPRQYIVQLSLYCGNIGLSSHCAQQYGINDQFEKVLDFKVK